MKTGYIDIDSKIDELINEGRSVTNDRYSLVKWLYEKCVYKNSYGHVMDDPHMDNKTYGYVSPFPDWIVAEAAGPLFYNTGVCNNYAAEFMLITRALGFESYYFSGETRMANNAGFTGHAWCEIKINGVNYIFDTQIEDNVAESKGKIIYLYFYKTEKEMADRYVWNWDSINQNMAYIGSDAKIRDLENYLMQNNIKTITVKNFEELKNAVANVTQNGISGMEYYIILNGNEDENTVSEYLKNNVVNKIYTLSNMTEDMKNQYIRGSYTKVKAEYDFEMFNNINGVDIIGIVGLFIPQ